MMICRLKTCLIVGSNETFAPDHIHEVPSSVLDYVDLPSPKGAVTGAYGADGIRVLKVILSKELGIKRICQEIEFSVVRDIESSTRIDLEMLKDIKTLNLLRLRIDLVNIVNVFWRRFFVGSLPENEASFPKTATKRPDLIAKLRECEIFKHIDFFIYPVDLDDHIMVVGTYFKPEEISDLGAGSIISGKFKLLPPPQ